MLLERTYSRDPSVHLRDDVPTRIHNVSRGNVRAADEEIVRRVGTVERQSNVASDSATAATTSEQSFVV